MAWPFCFQKLDTIGKTVLAAAGFPLLIEITQLPFYDRCSDVDDIILNTAGIFLGALADVKKGGCNMNSLLTTNIYEPEGTVLICGTCLARMQPNAFAALESQADYVYSLCLEESHINMAVTKIGAMLSTGRIRKLIYATVDRSPHCTQLHYIDHEVGRMMPISAETVHYVAFEDTLYPISAKTIERAKTLRELEAEA